ncbi:MAG TPA: branched-chain amino acid ABC transporter permease [Candidatus Limnocylindria bacterium]
MRLQPRVIVIVAVALVAALALPRVLYPVLALNILTWGLFAMAIDLLLGFGGLLSFGHAAYWGVAGYAAGLAARELGAPYPLAVLAGIAAAAALAVPLGYLSLKRTGIYFAMVTLAFAQMLYYLANEARPITGGENGLQGIPRTFPGLTLGPSMSFYYAALPLVVLGYLAAYRIVHSPFGHVLVSIRDNEARAQALGYDTARYKLIAFVLSAALAGLAGSVYALGQRFASLELLHWSTSGEVVLMTVLGGLGTLWGGILGAGVFVLLKDSLSTSDVFRDAPGVVTGAIFIVIVLGLRRGLWPAIAGLVSRAARLRAAEKPAA